MRRDFCTYFDHRYLARGLAMYRSLKRNCPSIRLWVLCLSTDAHRALTDLSLPDIIPIRLEDFERGDHELLQAKSNRSLVEYYFTCTPSLPLYVLQNSPDVDLITYLDSDLYFFNSPEPIFDELGSNSIAIIAHRFAPDIRWMECTGAYNVGWLSFRRGNIGTECLTWWRKRCLEWCRDYVEEDRYADQKYLDRFPELFSGVRVIQHKGANLAAWNLKHYRLHERNGAVHVDDDPVIFYHFQGFRRIAPGVIDPGVRQYGVRVSRLMESKLFRPYLQALREGQRMVPSLNKATGAIPGLYRKLSPTEKGRDEINSTRRMVQTVAAYVRLFTRHTLLSPGR